MLQAVEDDDFVWDVEEVSAANIGLDLSVVDTTMFAAEEKTVYPKVMTHDDGYPMSKFYLNFLNSITLFKCLFVPFSVEIKEVSHSIKNGWIVHYRCLQYISCFDR